MSACKLESRARRADVPEFEMACFAFEASFALPAAVYLLMNVLTVIAARLLWGTSAQEHGQFGQQAGDAWKLAVKP